MDIWNGYIWREKSIRYGNVVDTGHCFVFRIQRHCIVYKCRLRDMDWTSIYVGARSTEGHEPKGQEEKDRYTG